jgi:hypothetical protein
MRAVVLAASIAAGCGGSSATAPVEPPPTTSTSTTTTTSGESVAELTPELLHEIRCCEHPDDEPDCGPIPRRLDLHRVETVAAAPVAEARAGYVMDTSGDQMFMGGCRGIEVGLGVVVHVGDRIITQMFASCGGAGIGTMDGEAQCDAHSFMLAVEGDAAVVREDGREVLRVPFDPQ